MTTVELPRYQHVIDGRRVESAAGQRYDSSTRTGRRPWAPPPTATPPTSTSRCGGPAALDGRVGRS